MHLFHMLAALIPLIDDSAFTQSLVAIVIPILTGYITKWLANAMKRLDAYAASRPLVKQLSTFAIAFVLSLITNIFGVADIGVILNTIIGGGLAQVFYNGKKISQITAGAPPA
jgi:uncharacterized membrane protein